MKIIVSARHFDLTPALKDFAHEQLNALTKYFDQVIEVDLVLRVDETKDKADQQIAEAHLWASGARLNGEAHAEDMYQAIQAVASKLEKQLKRYKDKLRGKRKKGRRNGEPSVPQIPVTHSLFELDHEDESAQGPKIVRETDFVLQPLTVEEASLQLQEFDRDFVVFSNIDTNHLGVVYKRPDGVVGWIEAKTVQKT